MNNCLRLSTPQYLRAGRGTAQELLNFLKEMGIPHPFFVIDPTVLTSGKIENILRSIAVNRWTIFSKFTTNPTVDQIDEAASLFRQGNYDGLVAIGGGSAIDLGKATLLVALNGGQIKDYLNGKKGERPFLPFTALPTTCGTGSETSPYCVITDPALRKKRGIENYNFLPKLVILDPILVESLEAYLIGATAIDALAHVIESYISKKASVITRMSGRGLLMNIVRNIEQATFEKDLDALYEMMGVAFSSRLLYPRTGLTVAHALSHPLGAHTGLHHGLAVFFFLPASLNLNYNYCQKHLNDVLNILGFKQLQDFNNWLAAFAEKAEITKAISSHLSSTTIPVRQIAIDALESSNIPSNPSLADEATLVSVIEKSIIYWKIQS